MPREILANPLFESSVVYKAETIPYPKAWITLGISAAFLAGIFCATVGFIGMPFVMAGFLAFAAAFLCLPVLKMPRAFAVFLFVIFFFGAFYLPFYRSFRLASAKIPQSGATFEGTVVNEPQISGNYERFTLALAAPYRGNIAVVAYEDSAISYGSILEVKGTITPDQHAVGMAAFPKVSALGRDASWSFSIRGKLIGIKTAFIASFPKFFATDESALLEGLTFGVQNDFSKDFKTRMALSGTTHIVALSGYNISILVLAVSAMLTGIISRRTRFWTTIIIIFAFVLMVGATASVVRAATMGVIMLLAQQVGRTYWPAAAISLAAALMTLFDPTTFSDVGFALSFLALLGIIYIKPAIESALRIRETEEPHPIRETALTTLSAQLAVIPVLIVNFDQFSFSSIFANVLILEFVPLTMLLGFVLGMLGILSYYLAYTVAKFAGVLLVYEVGVISLFAHLQIPFPVSFASWISIAIYYALIMSFIWAMERKEPITNNP